MKSKVTSIFKKILMVELVICLFWILQSTTYAVFDPPSIPEEEQSAIAAEYYDEVDKRIDEKIKLIQSFDKARQKSSDTYSYINDLRNFLKNKLYKVTLPQTKSSYANYVRENAAAYALNYANSHNSAYKNLGINDCTNFVSQAVAVGGVYSYINSNFTTAPSLLKDWILDSTPNYWYMIKKTRPIGLNYWQYSESWAFVSVFRTFHKARSASGSNYFQGNLTSGTAGSSAYVPNKTLNQNSNFEYKLRKNAKIGQVWQSGNQHAIIITKVDKKSDGYNYVWYSCHSNPKRNEDIQTFFNWVYSSRGNEKIHRLDFS